jgi:hypothetical protein
VPFTLAHAAAALPSRRLHLIPSAVVMGTFAPDFEYFLHLAPDSGFGHTLQGIAELSFPLAMLMLWIFHSFVKVPLVGLLPNGIQRRLTPYLTRFSFRGRGRLLLIAASVLLGMATHVVWDSFTHPNTWLYYHFLILRQTLPAPFVGSIAFYKLLQHASTIVGLAILAFWTWKWYATTVPCAPPTDRPSRGRDVFIVVVITSISVLGAIARVYFGNALDLDHFSFSLFAGQTVVALIALTWWQLVLYGVYETRRRSRRRHIGARAEKLPDAER